jgi:signal transduction histidine kinase
MRGVKVGTKLGLALAGVTAFLLAVQVGALVVVARLTSRLNESTRFNLLAGEVANALQAYRNLPHRTAEHAARIEDLTRWAQSPEEGKLLASARAEILMGRPATSLELLGQYYRRAIEQAHQELVKIHRRVVIGLWFIMVDSLVLVVLLMLVVRAWVLRPLRFLVGGAAAVAAGDLERRVSPIGGEEFAQIAAAMNQMAGQLHEQREASERSQRLAGLGEACSHVTHNVRSLLGSIRSLAQYESNATDTPADARVGFNYIIALVQKLDQWVRDMHSSLSPLNPRRTAQDLEPVIHDLMTLMEPKISEKGLRVDFQVADRLPRVPVDRGLFEQAFLAVLTNAIEAAPENSRLGVQLRGADGEVAIGIEDAGPGMSEETKQRAFQPYFTTKSDSAGLGLTIANSIVKKHDGTVEIDSAPKAGTRITLRFPAMKSA